MIHESQTAIVIEDALRLEAGADAAFARLVDRGWLARYVGYRSDRDRRTPT
jgi:hypothetical protein